MSKMSTGGENINFCWSPDGTQLAVGSKVKSPSHQIPCQCSVQDDVITILDVQGAKVIHKMQFNFEVNEISWNPDGTLFFVTTGPGTVNVLEYPSFKTLHTLQAHTANCYCIEFEPKNRYLAASGWWYYVYRYFAVGAADALVSLWDLSELTCVRTLGRLEYVKMTLNFLPTVSL